MAEVQIIRSGRRTLALEITPQAQVLVRAPFFVSEETVNRFLQEKSDWIERHLTIMRQRQATAVDRTVTPEQEQALRRRAAAELPLRVAFYSAVMGVKPTGIRITGAQKRFGSCSSKNSLCFSWRLMQYPPEAVDYVVVHELSHIRHHDHSPAFYAFLSRYMPDYRAREKLLRQ